MLIRSMLRCYVYVCMLNVYDVTQHTHSRPSNWRAPGCCPGYWLRPLSDVLSVARTEQDLPTTASLLQGERESCLGAGKPGDASLVFSWKVRGARSVEMQSMISIERMLVVFGVLRRELVWPPSPRLLTISSVKMVTGHLVCHLDAFLLGGPDDLNLVLLATWQTWTGQSWRVWSGSGTSSPSQRDWDFEAQF